MVPRIVNSLEKKLIGIHVTMSFANNKTGELWGKFMPQIRNIAKAVSNDKISMQIYPENFFSNFQPENAFVKWAAVEVYDFDNIPNEMESFILPEGLYAVFDYKGSGSDNSIFQYIFGTWLSYSEYMLDDRPHFEVLGEKYNNNDPDSEEEIWIPVKPKQYKSK